MYEPPNKTEFWDKVKTYTYWMIGVSIITGIGEFGQA